MIPLMSISRNFFLGSEPTNGLGSAAHVRRQDRRQGDPRGAEGDGDRPARHVAAGRHPLRRRAPVGGDRARDPLRGEGRHPRRADVRARREGGRRRPALHRPGAGVGHRRDPHHPQRQPRLSRRRSVLDPRPRPGTRDVHPGRADAGQAPRADGRWRRAQGARARAGGSRRHLAPAAPTRRPATSPSTADRGQEPGHARSPDHRRRRQSPRGCRRRPSAVCCRGQRRRARRPAPRCSPPPRSSITSPRRSREH